MEENKATWKEAITFWWALTWRSILFILPTTAAIGMAVGFIMASQKIPAEPYMMHIQGVGLVIGVIISMLIIKNLLSKEFGSFKVVVIREHGENA